MLGAAGGLGEQLGAGGSDGGGRVGGVAQRIVGLGAGVETLGDELTGALGFGLRDLEVGLGLGELLGGNRAADLHGLLETGFGFGERRGGLGDECGGVVGAESGQHLAGRNQVALAHGDFEHRGGQRAADGNARRRGDAPGGDHGLGQRRPGCRDDIHVAAPGPQRERRHRAGHRQRHDQRAGLHAALASRAAAGGDGRPGVRLCRTATRGAGVTERVIALKYIFLLTVFR